MVSEEDSMTESTAALEPGRGNRVERREAAGPAIAIPNPPKSRRTVALVLAGLLAGLLLGFMDVTIVSVAGPTIVSEMGGLNLFAWVFSSFLIVQTVTIPIFGKLSDLYGRKRFFLLGLVVFMAGSALSGASQNIYELILFRAVQGIGFGAFVPATIAIAGDMFPPERRGQAQGLLFSINGVAFAIAPALGSFMIETLSWRWIFYINLPVGAVSLVLIYAALRESKAMNASPFSDWLGTATLVGFLGLLMMALFLGGSTFAWTSWAELSLFAGSVLLLCAFAFAELRAKEPVLPPRLFRIRNVSVATTVNLLRAVAFFAVIVYIPLFAAKGLDAGIGEQRNVLYSFTLPLTAGILVGGTAISRLGFKTPALLGAVIASIGLLLLTTMRSSSSILQLMEFCVPVGFGNGMMIPATIVAFQNSVQKREIGIASGLATFTLNLGGSIGVSVLGAVQIGLLNSELSRWLAAAPGLMSGIIEREAFSQSILPIFSISLVVSGATFVAVLLLKRVSTTEPAQGPGRLPRDM
jgi:EmrB/QacA subfamily drug resistance transporter